MVAKCDAEDGSTSSLLIGGTVSSTSSFLIGSLLRPPRRARGAGAAASALAVRSRGRESRGSSSFSSSVTSNGLARVPRRTTVVFVVDAPAAGVGVLARVLRVGFASAVAASSA